MDGPRSDLVAGDGGPRDQGSADRAPADQQGWDLADLGQPGCEQLYGALNGFLLCQETSSTCRFYFRAPKKPLSCDVVCERHGESCLASFYDDGDDDLCSILFSASCQQEHKSGICVCSR